MAMLKWWFIFCSSLVGLLATYRLGYLQQLPSVDASYMGLLCLALYAYATLRVGVLTRRASKGQLPSDHDQDLIESHAIQLLELGMVGTLIGFMISLFAIDTGSLLDIAVSQKTLITMMQGLGTAIITTLLGLVLKLLLTLQILNLRSLQK